LTLKYVPIIIELLIKLLLSETNKKTRINSDPIQESPKGHQTRFFANELYGKRRGIILHDKNNYDFSSVQTMHLLAFDARDSDEIFITNKSLRYIYNSISIILC